MTICPGDLVIVVRSTHSCSDAFLGTVATVAAVSEPGAICCAMCGGGCMWDALVYLEHGNVLPLSFLKKINPPAVRQSVEEEAIA